VCFFKGLHARVYLGGVFPAGDILRGAWAGGAAGGAGDAPTS
jgi:hypothetical protein